MLSDPVKDQEDAGYFAQMWELRRYPWAQKLYVIFQPQSTNFDGLKWGIKISSLFNLQNCPSFLATVSTMETCQTADQMVLANLNLMTVHSQKALSFKENSTLVRKSTLMGISTQDFFRITCHTDKASSSTLMATGTRDNSVLVSRVEKVFTRIFHVRRMKDSGAMIRKPDLVSTV